MYEHQTRIYEVSQSSNSITFFFFTFFFLFFFLNSIQMKTWVAHMNSKEAKKQSSICLPLFKMHIKLGHAAIADHSGGARGGGGTE